MGEWIHLIPPRLLWLLEHLRWDHKISIYWDWFGFIGQLKSQWYIVAWSYIASGGTQTPDLIATFLWPPWIGSWQRLFSIQLNLGNFESPLLDARPVWRVIAKPFSSRNAFLLEKGKKWWNPGLTWICHLAARRVTSSNHKQILERRLVNCQLPYSADLFYSFWSLYMCFMTNPK